MNVLPYMLLLVAKRRVDKCSDGFRLSHLRYGTLKIKVTGAYLGLKPWIPER